MCFVRYHVIRLDVRRATLRCSFSKDVILITIGHYCEFRFPFRRISISQILNIKCACVYRNFPIMGDAQLSSGRSDDWHGICIIYMYTLLDAGRFAHKFSTKSLTVLVMYVCVYSSLCLWWHIICFDGPEKLATIHTRTDEYII